MSEDPPKSTIDTEAIDHRLSLIHARLHQRHIGLVSAPYLDFEEHVEEDLAWLLEFIESGTLKAHAKASEAMDMFDEVKEGILKLPEALNNTESGLATVANKLRETSEFLHRSRELVSRMRNELGLLDETADVQLRAAQQEMVQVRSQLGDERSRHHRTKQGWDEDKKEHAQQIDNLRAEKNRLATQVRDLTLKLENLQQKIDTLPSTWHERVLADEGTLPEWVKVGAAVKLKGHNICGKISEIQLRHIEISTPSGMMSSPLKTFSYNWERT